MTRGLYALGRFCVRWRWPVVLAWVIIVVGVGAWAKSAGSQASDSLKLPNTGSQEAVDVLDQRFPAQSNGSSPIVVHSNDKGDLTSPANSAAIAKAVAAAKSSPSVLSAVNPIPAVPPDPVAVTAAAAAGAMLSKDKKTALIPLTLKDSIVVYTVDEAIAIVEKTEAPLDAAGLETAAGGDLGLKATRPASDTSVGIGVAAALVVLLVTFGSAVSMVLPIITAAAGIATGLSIITLLSHVTSVPTAAPTLAVMIGLGVGIDYSLFVLSRHREQIAGGMDLHESIARSVATSGAAVVFAGATVILALCSLALAQIPIVTGLGFMSAVAVVTAMLSAITLLPAAMGILGHRVDSLRLPWLHRRSARAADHDSGGWARWARGIGRHPWPPMLAAVAILLVLSIPTLSMVLGQPDTAAGPKSSDSTRAYDLVAAGFGEGVNGPVIIAAKLTQPKTDDATIEKLSKTIATDKDVVSVAPPLFNAQRTAAVFTVTPKSAPPSQATQDLVERLRSTVIPGATKGTGVTAYVGGATAAYIDIATGIADSLPRMILIVVALSFALLLIAFRSVLVPLQAAFMNLLGVAASYGMLVAVFQWGWATDLIGLQGMVPIVSFVPLMMFAILFGLSMDYEVFLVSHIQEEHEQGADNETAVARGLSRSARVITSAALIMVCVFGSFVLNDDPTVKQFGLGLAFAVAIDATVVRCLLVPALMVIIGKKNWWLPKWMAKILPKASIEGTEYFKRLDAERAAK